MVKNRAKRHSPESSIDINIFSGAGGLALGLTEVGFEPVQYYDKDAGACATLRHNLKSQSSPLRGEVHEADICQMEWIRYGPDVRLLAAGAPCQPFSMGGARQGPKDRRNLFPELMKAVRALRPRAVLVENVRGLERGAHKLYLDYVIRQLSHVDIIRQENETWQDHDLRLLDHSLGKKRKPSYRVKWGVLNTADFGVAQMRYRLFIIATQIDDQEYRFPEPTHSRQKLRYQQAVGTYWEERSLAVPSDQPIKSIQDDSRAGILPWATVRDAFTNLPPIGTCDDLESNNHYLIPGARSYPGHSGSRLDWPSKTVKAGVHGVPGGENTLICDDGSFRYFSLREIARIQSFPDNHYFPGARSNVTRQIGNAVPCALAKAVARPLFEILK